MVLSSICGSLNSVFMLLIPGMIFRRKDIITDSQSSAINSIIVNLTWPCLVIDAMQLEYSIQMMKDSISMLLICFIVFFGIVILSIPASKLKKMNRTRQFLMCFMLLFGNTGFIGIPVTRALYGENAIFYAAIIELINDVLIFTVGMFLIQKSAGAKLKIEWKELLSPGMIGVILGISLFVLEIQLPKTVGTTIEMIGDATTPLTMFMIGFQIGGLKWKDIINDLQVYSVCIIKLILIPILLILFLRFMKTDFTLLEKTLILSFAMPVGSVSAIFSKQYQSDSEFAAKCVLISTVLCLMTIPIWAILLEM